MDLRALREATQEQHDRVEVLLPLTDPGLDLERYLHSLQCFYRIVHGWETWAAAHVPPHLAGLVHERRRTSLLRRDLHFFGLAAPTDSESRKLPSLEKLLAGTDRGSDEHAAAFLGAMYVMEGSTLGGQYIAKHVEEVLGLVPGQGDAYFRGYGERTGAMWNAFRQRLGVVPDAYSATVIAAARAAFAYVQETMLSCSTAVHTAEQALS